MSATKRELVHASPVNDALSSSQVDSPYLSSRSYRAAKDYNVSLPDMAPFSIWNPFYFVRRLRRYTRIARDYTRILVVSKEFLAKGQITDVGKHPIEWRNGRLVTLREFLEAGDYSIEFSEFFVPLVASTCSCSFDSMMEYPACVVLEYVARCMPFGRMQSVLVGEQRVAARLAENVGTIHYNTTIERIAETDITSPEDGPVTLIDSYGVPRTFDHVIFATQADQAAAILARFKPKSVPSVLVSTSSDNERSDSSGSQSTATGAQLLEETPTSHPFYQQIRMLLRFPYERVQVVCHSDLSFLPKNPSHWRQLNVAKAKDADVMACPLERWSKELDQEIALNSRKTYRRRTSIFSLRPPRILSRKSSSIGKHQDRPFFSPTPTDPLDTRSNSGSPSTSGSVMTTQVVNRLRTVDAPILQTTNPLFPPRPDLIISSTWLERAVVNVESAKALDHLHRQMDRQQDSSSKDSPVPSRNIAVSRPIIYGNSATPLNGKKVTDPDHTHRWTISVRGVNNEDISYFIKKVAFKLHDTYENPNRVIEKPPFEVTETGWGEFDVIIKLHFHPVSGEKPQTLYHHLKLHPYEEDGLGIKSKPVTSYLFDEVVFNEPVDTFYQVLQENSTSSIPPKKTQFHQFSLQYEQDEVDKLDKAIKSTSQEIARHKEKCKRLEAELAAK
ncbi:NuA4 histone H4 acetyltransferase complex and the SWR1 complex subunit [Podila horticola]|nr:NuA4 histone H4 acetyltransferase complex and the SWR1 complex subunit [Podila horticola]